MVVFKNKYSSILFALFVASFFYIETFEKLGTMVRGPLKFTLRNFGLNTIKKL